MYNNKMIAMMLTLSMLAASLAGCAGGDDDWDAENAASDVSVVWVESAWDPIIPNLNAGEMCDVIISAMTKTDARDEVVDFTRAYYTSSQGVIGGSGATAISDVSELNVAGVTVGVQSGTTSDIYANGDATNDAMLANATVVAYEDFPTVIAALNNGDVMYALGDAPVLSLESDLMTSFSDENFGFAVREDSGELLDALNAAIGAIIDSGEYDAIYAASFNGAVTLADDSTADTATAYPATPGGKSDLAGVLDSGALNICTDPFYAPFESYDADMNVVGFDADIAHAIADEIAAHYMGTANPMFSGDPLPEPATLIRIGFLNDASGPIAQFAAPFTYAWGQAQDDLNAVDPANYVFEVIEADSGCDGTMAQTAAQSLLDAGVVAVAGAACSGASMGANAILSAAGVPMISYASTSPALAVDADHPLFYRIVPSDALQGQAAADMIAASGVTNTAVIHMTNSYGAGLADAVVENLGAANVCLQAGYEETATDFAAAVQSVIDAGCDSAFLASYSADGAMIVETMAALGAAIPTFSADGMAGEAALGDYSVPAAANLLQVTKPRAAAAGAGVFTAACAADAVCSTGIYQSESYDTVMMLGHAAMHGDGDMSSHIEMVGNGYAGESGTHTFLANGDVGGSGYDVCTFFHVPTYGEYFNCDKMWDATGGLSAVTWAGATVKIGFLNDASGPIAVYGAGFVAASQIALGLANTIGYSSGVQFELVYADSGCDGAMGGTAAQTLADAGVWGVVGAACSGATMGANAVLSAAGIPQVSYASTSPALTDATAYPNFFRVVPSDAFQGAVVADVMIADGQDNVAVVHMTNAYGAGLADAFVANMDASHVCTQVGYEETATDFGTYAQAVVDAGCTSVLLVSYASDGAGIIEELAAKSYAGAIYGADGIAEEGLAAGMADTTLVDGIIATKPAAAGDPGMVAMVFAGLCAQSADCAGGIYTAEAFDAVTIVAFAAFTALATPGLDATTAVMGTGQGWNGASGTISFLANGDVPAAGFCIGEFTSDGTTVSYDCVRSWDPINGITTTV
jgi:branched-chain amino acid transport system substrate-binding protein